ncbi:D-alanine--D-alanine ligase [Mucilaginibacter myungsuensis]|uniref:D-alanine--D-alanine ligase n=1 Tax=Mucilaginibacter myungsuensis TaxID=649104 RepID=A0A929L515_9SPHI|nr:D-alanine--D-alanine ligase [Mucilaginibacter myungsuensis]MBE9664589.1 D-alanine--D-alanine ligase [Mucilaginibacter myungsuensis]MDN3601061.1 D-alanine--D-alanine ligase [Mucilaginibacter myungsuensis]
MATKNIALMAGGYSGEYQVSLNSAKNIKASLDATKYTVYTILLNKDDWFYEADGQNISINKNDFSLTLNGQKIKFDAAFITVHGTPGEDGKLQGYFDMIGIPYNTCDATTSAITMNKAYTKAIIHSIRNLHTAKSMQLFDRDLHEVAVIANALKFPLFIKPNNGGSSVGMSKVHNVAALPEALEKAFNEDSQVLVEEFIKGREFSIGIARLDGHLEVLPATEIITSKEFFDYEAKYTDGITKEVTPADLSAEKKEEIAQIVTEVYLRLNCKGMVRIDFILQENTNDFYFIEVNTTPGQSAASLIPQQVRAAGMDVGEFYGKLIEGCL